MSVDAFTRPRGYAAITRVKDGPDLDPTVVDRVRERTRWEWARQIIQAEKEPSWIDYPLRLAKDAEIGAFIEEIRAAHHPAFLEAFAAAHGFEPAWKWHAYACVMDEKGLRPYTPSLAPVQEEFEPTYSAATKQENNAFFQRGFYGNKLRTWGSLDELKASGYTERFSMRYLEPASPYCKYDVDLEHVEMHIGYYETLGADRTKFIFGELAPDKRLTIQGEVQRSEKGLEFHCSTYKGRMREAMKDERGARTYTGAAAQLVLRDYLSGASYEDLQELLDLFPDHIIELSAYEMCLGSCPGRNTLIWEVRRKEHWWL